MNVMAQAHQLTKAKIAYLKESGITVLQSYAHFFKDSLKQAHKQFKIWFAAKVIDMSRANRVHTIANTHELKEGDVVYNYGVYFLLTGRKVWPLAGNECPTMQGECITFVGNPVAEDANHQFPRHWLKDYTIQGNKLATWCVISAE